MYQALYRRFRPETFDEVLGQEHIVKILRNQIRTGTTGHAYLFCGTRGTGKTTTARLLAKGLNCLAPEDGRPCGTCDNCRSITEGTFMDVMEIDAASNNGVENIRELRESVKYPPVTGRCKVYIVDEVHMLSTGAFNALLKTLEEPPENVMFILATTEVQKLPATILSRCLRLDFHRVPETQLRRGMAEICKTIGVEIEASALGLIAANADGSVRDGLSLLDQCISGGEKNVSREDVLALLGTSGEEVFVEMTDYVQTMQVAEALLLLDRVLSDGKDVRQFIKDWIAHFRSLMMTKFIKNPEDLLNMSSENVDRIRVQSERLDLAVINGSILELSKTLADAKWSTQPRILLELAIVRMGSGDVGVPTAAPGGVRSAAAVRKPASSQAFNPSFIQPVQAQMPVQPQTAEEQKTPEEPAAESPAAPEAAGETKRAKAAVVNYDLDDLWHRVFEAGEAVKGSFNLLRRGTSLLEVGHESFTIQVSNEIMEKFAKENKAALEEIMQRQTGLSLHMVCRLPQADSKDQDGAAKSLAEDMEKKLGINIEVR